MAPLRGFGVEVSTFVVLLAIVDEVFAVDALGARVGEIGFDGVEMGGESAQVRGSSARLLTDEI